MNDIIFIGVVCAFAGVLLGYKFGFDRGFDYALKVWKGDEK